MNPVKPEHLRDFYPHEILQDSLQKSQAKSGSSLKTLAILWGSDSFVIENSTPKKAQNARKHKHAA